MRPSYILWIWHLVTRASACSTSLPIQRLQVYTCTYLLKRSCRALLLREKMWQEKNTATNFELRTYAFRWNFSPKLIIHLHLDYCMLTLWRPVKTHGIHACIHKHAQKHVHRHTRMHVYAGAHMHSHTDYLTGIALALQVNACMNCPVYLHINIIIVVSQ